MSRRSVIALLVLTALVAGGCAASSGTLEAGARQDELAPALLTLSDVLAAPGAPAGIDSVEPDRANLREESNPRGPCGATIEALPVLDGALAVFGQDDIVVVNVVLAGTSGLAERLITATRDDLSPGCESFEKDEESFDDPQLTELLGEVDVSGGDEAVAYLIKGTVGDNDPVFGAQALVRSGDDLTAIVILSTTSIDPGFVSHLATTAAARLDDFSS